MGLLIKVLLKISSLFSAVFGPLFVMWTGFSLKLFPTWSDSTVLSVSSAFWAGIIQLILLSLAWILNNTTQSANIYVSKNNSFDNDNILTAKFGNDPVQLYFRIEINGSNKLLSKKTVELIFPRQVELQGSVTNEYYRVIDNRVVINLKNVLLGQTKHLNDYTQDFTIFLIKNEESFQNNLSVEKNNGLLKQNLMTKVRMVSK